MLWFRIFLAVGIFILSPGCGFRSLYNDYHSGGLLSELASIHILPIENRIGQQTHNHLLDRLNPHGRPTKPLFDLSVAISQATQSYAIGRDSLATRENLTATARYKLTSRATGKVLKAGTIKTIVSYNITAAQYAVVSAKRNAQKRAANALANDITTHLRVYFAQPKKRKPHPPKAKVY